jgi:hypothetical protein
MKSVSGLPMVTVEQCIRYHEAASEIERQRDKLLAALKEMRDEFNGLPHSLGYEFTHLPKIEALIEKVEASK